MLSTLASVLLATPHPFKNCAAADHVHVSRIELSPDPPKPGLNVDVTFNATPDVAVSDGTLHVTVTLFGVPVPDTPTFQLCSEIGVKCPVAPGQNISGHAAYGVSKIVPSGIHVTITLTAKTAAGATIGCVSFDTPIGHAGVLEEIGGAAVPWSASARQLDAVESPAGGGEEAERWRAVFALWRAQHGRGASAYADRSEEARRLSIFKANIVGYEKRYRETGVMPTADAHADRTRDEVATLSHFA